MAAQAARSGRRSGAHTTGGSVHTLAHELCTHARTRQLMGRAEAAAEPRFRGHIKVGGAKGCRWDRERTGKAAGVGLSPVQAGQGGRQGSGGSDARTGHALAACTGNARARTLQHHLPPHSNTQSKGEPQTPAAGAQRAPLVHGERARQDRVWGAAAARWVSRHCTALTATPIGRW